MAKNTHWMALLTSPDKSKLFIGRHTTEKKAKAAARKKCSAAGFDPDTFTEQAWKITGPAARTLARKSCHA